MHRDPAPGAGGRGDRAAGRGRGGAAGVVVPGRGHRGAHRREPVLRQGNDPSPAGGTGAGAGRLGALEASLPLLAVPEGVRQVPARRFARLPGNAGRVAVSAPGFAGPFLFPVAAVAASLGDQAALAALDELLAAGLIRPAGAAERYEFVHALARQAIYDTLSPSRQARLHRRLAQALEAARQQIPACAEPVEIVAQYASTWPGTRSGPSTAGGTACPPKRHKIPRCCCTCRAGCGPRCRCSRKRRSRPGSAASWPGKSTAGPAAPAPWPLWATWTAHGRRCRRPANWPAASLLPAGAGSGSTWRAPVTR